MKYNIDLPEKLVHVPESAIHYSFYDTLNEYLESTGSDSDYLFRPLANISESSNHYEISFLLPVGSMDMVTVIVKDRYLVVHGKGKPNEEHDVFRKLKREYDNSCFFRAVLLPEDADPGHFSKRYHNGEFKVRLAKKKATIENHITFQNRIRRVAQRLHEKMLHPVIFMFLVF